MRQKLEPNEAIRPRSVLVTGATGFAGSYLLKLLQGSQAIVYGTCYPEEAPPDAANLFYLDLREEQEVFDLIKKLKPDWVFHLAALSNVKQSWERRRETMETNVMGYFFLLEALRCLERQARVLFVSSSDIYGTRPDKGTKEFLTEEDPIQLINPYAFTKACGEWLSRFYVACHELDIVIARSFPHTGPGQSAAFVCSDWARQVVRIEKGLSSPVIKVGNIDLERDYTDVRDTVRAYLLLMQKGRSGEVYNVCSGQPVKLREILEFMLRRSSAKVQVEVDQERLRKMDIPRLVGDNRKIKRETGWQAEIPLHQTLDDLLAYWREKESP